MATAVVGYEDLYQVSDRGRIKSLHCRSSKVLRPLSQGKGYLQVCLCKNGEKKRYTIHRLVLGAFSGVKGLETNHKDYDRSNNRLDNLEYVTRSENNLHKYLRHKRGIIFIERVGKYRSSIKYKGKTIYLGYFWSKEKAYIAFYNKYLELRGIPPWSDLD